MNITELFDLTEDAKAAWDYAQKQHAGQTRSDGSPYANHVERVAKSVEQFKKSHNLEALIQAAYLHDTIEDTGTTFEDLEKMFGGLVASLVQELTSDKDEIARVGKAEYLSHKMATMSSYALVIKLADRLDNVSDLHTAKNEKWRQKYRAETKQILDYIEKNRVLSGTHKKIIGLIRHKIEEI